MDVVYSKEEREEILQRMEATSNAFYYQAIQTGCHPFIEFCGLMNEYIKLCQEAHEQGIDFTQANRHTGQGLKLKDHHAKYLGEKIGCIYGPSLRGAIRKAFLYAIEEPHDAERSDPNS